MNLIETFDEFKGAKNIDRPAMVRVLEDVLRTLIKKKYNTDENFDVIVNPQKGDMEMWRVRSVVPDGEVTDDRGEIALSDAVKVDASLEVGDECYEQLFLDEFGRRAIMAARQTLVSRIMELEKDEVYRRYKDRIGEMVLGEVSQIMKREFLILDDATGSELVLRRDDTIRGDFFRKGDMVKAIIRDVEMRNNIPVVLLSRTDNSFLAKLLEQEVPEIEDGIIAIRSIVRIPGERAKVAVESFDDRIDPVGACVGMKGSRIHGIVRELRNENIDIINFTTNDQLFLQRSLTPAKISNIEIEPAKHPEDRPRASVYLPADQVSLAIGKGGSNIKLASQLTGFEIDVYRDTDEFDYDEDVELDEFRDEIEEWIIEALKNIGCDTAKSVLELSAEEIVRRADIELETAQEVLSILRAEFEDEENA